MKDKTDKKIEEILGTRKDIIDLPSTGSHEGDRDRVIAYEKLKKQLTDLINTEVQKAVREHIVGFLKWFELYEYHEWDGELIETYLQSLDKRDGE